MSDDADRIEEAPPKSKGPVRVTLKDGTKIKLPFVPSVTSIEGYIKCPRQWWFRNVLGEIRPPGIFMVQGTGGHKALEQNNLHKIKTGRDLAPKKVVEVFRDSFSSLAKEVAPGEWNAWNSNKDKAAEEVATPLKHYMERVADKILAVTTEAPWEGTAFGVPFVGHTDITTADAVLDYKIAGPRSSYLKPETAEQSLQLSLYSALTKHDRVGYLALVRGRAEFRRVPAKRSKQQRNNARREVVHVAKAISAGSFPMCPVGSWYCSARWCGFHAMCRGAKGGKGRQP